MGRVKHSTILRVCPGCLQGFFPRIYLGKETIYCTYPCSVAGKRAAQQTLAARFWQDVAICGHGIDCPYCCWPWVGGGMGAGYGMFAYQRKQYLSHRAAYAVWHQRPVPPGHDICHHCDVRRCCNFDHLFPGTRRDNIHDAMRKGRLMHGAGHYATDLTTADVLAMYRALQSGIPATALAAQYHVHPRTIRDIKNHKTWEAVTRSLRT